ncbi:Uncharacterized membrane protein [Pseudooceanicola antarcticus]|uniref:DUF2244 domain-containing protein n=1 Tax=Pseudooceanicola antarcticus TaxID=1247613 RepID=A0A285IV42_9RHOB|nr:DUF2244 domain-containing protein [Pseudooceanicola antarcticus]PJE32101.1 DUF2244 domain-containing protein [Pseudooceanicola antarcticus]SNY51557.1 Uncharacterized membrane protein [Pseudooceanicola antarcticus]
MPYRWTSDTDLELTPHRSLPPQGFAAVILTFFTLAMIPLTAFLGTMALWGLLPFALLATWGLWWGLRRSYADGLITEQLRIGEAETLLTRDGPRDSHAEWRCNTYWVRVTDHETGGPVPHYLTLSGNGREVEIGAFLSEDERKRLGPELRAAFRRT